MRLVLVATVCLAGCAVTEQDYPAAWDPPQRALNCEHLAGSYADRGEATGTRAEPSLTLGLFGHHSVWQDARRVDLALPGDGVLDITVWDDTRPVLTRTLTRTAGELDCADGVLIVRSRRWVAANVLAGRQDVTIELSHADGKLIAHVREATYGAIFAVVPIAGTATHWYRFARLAR